MPHVQQVHYFVCEHARLSRPRARYHEFGAAEIFYRRALGTVEFVEIVVVIGHLPI